jgi:hypothetical protein
MTRQGSCRAALVLALCCGGACSGSSIAPTDATVTTDSGALRVELRVSPQRGTNTAELTVTNVADGMPRDGIGVSVVPFMPSMNHGSSSPAVTPEGGGKYQVTQLYLYMPGYWELRTTLSGPPNDHVTLAVQVP